MIAKFYTILLIEDNDGDYKLVSEFLEEKFSAITILRAENCKSAQTLITNTNNLDAILLDLSLPDASGEILVTTILKLSISIPVIILTGNGDLNFSIKSINYGISDYLIKEDITPGLLQKSIIYSLERAKANVALRESEKRYHNLFQQSKEPICVYDLDTYQFIDVNKAAIDHYGYTLEEFLAKTIFDISPRSEFAKLDEALKNIRLNPYLFSTGKYKHQKKNGDIIDVELFGNPIVILNKIYRSVIAIDITEKLRAENEVSKAIIKTQEDERYEIGAELHDNVGQILTYAKVSLSFLKKHLHTDGEEFFKETKDNIQLALSEIRNLSHRLAPASFEEAIFEDLIKNILRPLEKKYDIVLTIDDRIENRKFNANIQLNLYRILQEQLINIQKHAQASKIILQLKVVGDDFEMLIKDNGIGFVKDKATSGIGITNINRRVALFDGTATINSQEMEGFELLVSIPMERMQ